MQASCFSDRTGTSDCSLLSSNMLAAGRPGMSSSSTSNGSPCSIGSSIRSHSGGSRILSTDRKAWHQRTRQRRSEGTSGPYIFCSQALQVPTSGCTGREQAEEQAEVQAEAEDKSNPEPEEPAREIPSPTERSRPSSPMEILNLCIGPWARENDVLG